MLPPNELDAYLETLTEEQAANVRALRGMILEKMPEIVEAVDTGKWFGGLLTYYTADAVFTFALGPLSGGFTTFHMMPYYSTPALQERNGEALKKLMTGKSCMKFKSISQVPEASLRDILDSTPAYVELARLMIANRRDGKKSAGSATFRGQTK